MVQAMSSAGWRLPSCCPVIHSVMPMMLLPSQQRALRQLCSTRVMASAEGSHCCPAPAPPSLDGREGEANNALADAGSHVCELTITPAAVSRLLRCCGTGFEAALHATARAAGRSRGVEVGWSGRRNTAAVLLSLTETTATAALAASMAPKAHTHANQAPKRRSVGVRD